MTFFFGTVRFVHDILVLFISVQQCKHFQCVCPHAEWLCVYVCITEDKRWHYDGVYCVLSIWCVLAHIFLPTASGFYLFILPVQLNEKRLHVLGVQIWDAKSVGYACMTVSVYANRIVSGCECCVYECVCVAEKVDWGVRCEICVMFDVFKPSNSLIFAIVCVVTPNYSWVSVGLFISLNKSDFLSEIWCFIFWKKFIRKKKKN